MSDHRSSARATLLVFAALLVPVDGMACVACAASVKSAVKALPGVVGVEVNLEKRNARVTYFASLLTPDRIVAAIDKLGYTAGMPKDAP